MKKFNNFVHLHVHTHFSLLDGLSSPETLIDKAIELGQPAIAITDHGNMFGVYEFYTKCKEKGIKPIIGLEAYIAPGHRSERGLKKGDTAYNHILLLAKNYEGYKNLMMLSTLSYTEGFYYRPRIDMELLKKYGKNLICTSACLGGVIPRAIMADNPHEAWEYINKYKDIFGDDFYLEVMDNGIPEQKDVNNWIFNTGFKNIVATNDVHYCNREDAEAQDALMCIGMGKNIYQTDRIKFPGNEFYLKGNGEMSLLFGAPSLDATLEIADKCNITLKKHTKIPTLTLKDTFAHLKDTCDMLIEGYPPEYKERYLYEIDAIERTGYAEYIYIVADFMQYARSNNIPLGAGRGSSAGSLVCYLLGITEIDPIKYGLLFERFININRIAPPDIDIDVCQAKRGMIINYLKHEYGHKNVAQLITYGTLQAKAAMRDTCRVLQLPFGVGDTICKIMGDHFDGDVEDVFKDDKINKYLAHTASEEQVNKLRWIAGKVEGKPRHSSTHAAGVVISSKPLDTLLPLFKRVSNDDLITQYDMHGIEELGLLKFDILGLRTLTVISDAAKYAGIDYKQISLEDSYTYRMLCKGETFGVFQYEGWGYTKFIKRLKPENFNHLVALGALYRPGPLNSGMADDYIDRMHGITWEDIDPELRETYGIMLYQEQIMQMVVKYAGFTLNEADELRKAIGKKDKDLMDKMCAKIRKNMLAKYLDCDLDNRDANVNDFVDKIITFSKYGWNKAHSVSYALLSYYTAYLKFHHPTSYFCAFLNSHIADAKRLAQIYVETKRYDIRIEPPNVNLSDSAFTLHDYKIYSGLQSIKGIGQRACEAIVSERDKGKYMSIDGFRDRVPPKLVNKTALQALIDNGAFTWV